MGVIWVVLRGWGVSLQGATTGMALYGMINTLGRFALPLFALILIAIAGGGDGTHSGARAHLGVISGVIFVVVTTVLVLRRPLGPGGGLRSAGRSTAGSGCSWDASAAPEHPDINAGIHRFRDELGEVVRRRGLAGADREHRRPDPVVDHVRRGPPPRAASRPTC